MADVPRTFSCGFILRPIARIAQGCRPLGRKDSHHTLKRTKVTKVEEAAKVVEIHKHPKAESDPLVTKFSACLGFTSDAVAQSQCPFISKLPVEVRVMIYYHVLCVPVPVIHVVRRKDGSLCHVRCRASKGEFGTYRCYNDYSELSRSIKSGPSTLNQGRGTTGSLLSLLLTCKKMLVLQVLFAILASF